MKFMKKERYLIPRSETKLYIGITFHGLQVTLWEFRLILWF